MSAIATNGAHIQDAEFAQSVHEGECPYSECIRDRCPLYEIVSFGEGSKLIHERFTCPEAAEIYLGGKV